MSNLFDLEALVAGLSTREMQDGLTVVEMVAKLGKSPEWVRTRLQILNAQGLLVIGKKKIIDLSGRNTFAPAYKIKLPRGKKR